MILDVLAAACAAFYLAEVAEWHHYIAIFFNRNPFKPFKPFSCTVCLAAWFGLLTGIIKGYGHESIQLMFVSGVTGVLLTRIFNRYL